MLSFSLCLTFYLAATPSLSIADKFPTPSPCPLVLPTPLDPVSRIVGGQITAGPPYIAAIFKGDEFYCTGALISSTSVLTAGHCVPRKRKLATKFSVRIGASTFDKGKKIAVKSLKRHPRVASKSYRFDMAVLRLNETIPNAQPIKITSSKPPLWSYARIIGYGYTSAKLALQLSSPDGFLRRTDVPISPCRWFDFLFILKGRNLKGTVCAGGSTVTNCTACFGDSGGPWVQYDSAGSPVLVGIHSTASYCNVDETVSVFVDARVIASWLKKIGVGFERAKKPVKHVFLDFTPSRPKGS